MIEVISKSWGWTGIVPKEIIMTNPFGNFIIKDIVGNFWRICPEEVSCEIIANSNAEYCSLLHDQEFIDDWEMKNLVEYSNQNIGGLSEGKSYCLKIPGTLGGEYGGDNIGIISTKELIEFSGHIGKEISDLPDGSQIELDFIK